MAAVRGLFLSCSNLSIAVRVLECQVDRVEVMSVSWLGLDITELEAV